MLHGFVNGLFILTLIAHTLCWYRIEEAALRFLLWSLVSPKCFQLLATLQVRYVSIASYAVNILLFYAIQVSGKSDGMLGGPREVSWLSAEQKVMYSRMAAAYRLFANPAGALWSQRRVGHTFTDWAPC